MGVKKKDLRFRIAVRKECSDSQSVPTWRGDCGWSSISTIIAWGRTALGGSRVGSVSSEESPGPNCQLLSGPRGPGKGGHPVKARCCVQEAGDILRSAFSSSLSSGPALAPGPLSALQPSAALLWPLRGGPRWLLWLHSTLKSVYPRRVWGEEAGSGGWDWPSVHGSPALWV